MKDEVRDVWQDQLSQERIVLRETNPIRPAMKTYEHFPVRINGRSKINLYKKSLVGSEEKLVKQLVLKANITPASFPPKLVSTLDQAPNHNKE